MTLNVTTRPDGMAIYRTVDGDMVDQIARAYYGTHLGSAEHVYAWNQDLSLQPLVLAAGISIVLPPFMPPQPTGQIKLWD